MKVGSLAVLALVAGLAGQIRPLQASETEFEMPRMTIKLPGGSISKLTVAATIYVDETLATGLREKMGAIREEVFASAHESFISRRSKGFAGIDATLLQERIAMGLTARIGSTAGLRVLFRELSTQ
jgi:hypothetical protein